MSGYTVQINYDEATRTALSKGQYSLYGFKAVSGPKNSGGAPTVWLVQSEFLAEGVNVKWAESYQAYISDDQIIPNGQISTQAADNAALGDIAKVDPTGGLTVDDGGPDPNGIVITNLGSTPLTCGISQLQGRIMTQTCAFPLPGHQAVDIIPIEKVMFFFGTTPFDTGTVIETASTQAVLLDMTENNSVTVNYDYNGGFDAGGAAFATLIDAGSSFIPLLVTVDGVHNSQQAKKVA